MVSKNALYNEDNRVDSPQAAMSHSANKMGRTSATGISNSLSGVAGTVANYGVNALTGNPNIGSGVGRATSAAMSGASPAQTVEAGVRGPVNAIGYDALSNVVGPVAGPVVAVGNAMFDNAMGRDVDPAKVGVQSMGSMFGSLLGAAVVPGVGSLLGMVTGAVAQSSYDNGAIGDGLDAREDEMARDDLESQGYSRSESKDITKADIDTQEGYSTSGYKGWGKARGTFTNPNVSNYDQEADNPGSGGHDAGQRGDTDNDSEPGGRGGV